VLYKASDLYFRKPVILVEVVNETLVQTWLYEWSRSQLRQMLPNVLAAQVVALLIL